MSIQRCPKCGSPRVQRGFDDPPLVLRLLCVYDLLCNNCDHEFRGFALHGSAKRTRQKTKADLSGKASTPERLTRSAGGKDRRRLPRTEAMAPIKLKLYGTDDQATDSVDSPVLYGHTRDLSEHGIAVIIPESRFNDRLVTNFRRLVITLDLPGRKAVRAYAVAVHYDLIVEGEFERGFCIGARITKMSTEDRFIYLDYLKSANSAADMDFDEFALVG